MWLPVPPTTSRPTSSVAIEEILSVAALAVETTFER